MSKMNSRRQQCGGRLELYWRKAKARPGILLFTLLKILPRNHPSTPRQSIRKEAEVLTMASRLPSLSMEFYNADSQTLVIKEHYRATDVVWDHDGRAVATCVTQPIGGGHFKFAMDNGYILWSFQGKQLYQQSFESFYQFRI